MLENGLYNTERNEADFWMDIKSPDLDHEDTDIDFSNDDLIKQDKITEKDCSNCL